MAETGGGPKRAGGLNRAHPWHGVSIGEGAPEVVTAYIEIVPTDTIKYEIDKVSGYLRVDRPQKYSSVSPSLYGFIPQTLCAERVAEKCRERSGRPIQVADGDPLDICVLTEKQILRGDLLMNAIPIGGFRLIDGDEADDKVIAVMEGDAVYGRCTDPRDLPVNMLERLRHYFLTYKDTPGVEPRVEITHIYGRGEALDVIRRAQDDYLAHFGHLAEQLERSHSS